MVWLELGLYLATYPDRGAQFHTDLVVSSSECEEELRPHLNSQFVSYPDGTYDTMTSPDHSMNLAVVHRSSI